MQYSELKSVEILILILINHNKINYSYDHDLSAYILYTSHISLC